MSPERIEGADFRRDAHDARPTADERDLPESRRGAEPADSDSPEFSRGQPLDDPQPSSPERPDLQAEDGSRPAVAITGAPRGIPAKQRAYIEALLEGVPLPATRSDLIKAARRYGSPEAVAALRSLPDQRFETLDEVGEALAPVQPGRPRRRRVPRPESDLPPGGAAYGIDTGGRAA